MLRKILEKYPRTFIILVVSVTLSVIPSACALVIQKVCHSTASGLVIFFVGVWLCVLILIWFDEFVSY
jgi:hypothetical protein